MEAAADGLLSLAGRWQGRGPGEGARARERVCARRLRASGPGALRLPLYPRGSVPASRASGPLCTLSAATACRCPRPLLLLIPLVFSSSGSPESHLLSVSSRPDPQQLAGTRTDCPWSDAHQTHPAVAGQPRSRDTPQGQGMGQARLEKQTQRGVRVHGSVHGRGCLC